MPTPQSKEKMLRRITKETAFGGYVNEVNLIALAEVLAELSEKVRKADEAYSQGWNEGATAERESIQTGASGRIRVLRQEDLPKPVIKSGGHLTSDDIKSSYPAAPDSLEEDLNKFWLTRRGGWTETELLSFIREKVKEAGERGRSGALNEVQIIVDEHNENCDPRYHAECLPIIKEKLTLIRNKK